MGSGKASLSRDEKCEEELSWPGKKGLGRKQSDKGGSTEQPGRERGWCGKERQEETEE